MPGSTVIRCVKSGSAAGLGNGRGWGGRGTGRERRGWHSSMTTLGKGGGGCSTRGYMLSPSPDSSEAKASPSSRLSRDSSPSVPFSVWLCVVENNVCGPLPGPSPQKQLWGQECETEAFRRLPDLNQSHRHAAELPIENCVIAKCRGIYLSVPEILISF